MEAKKQKENLSNEDLFFGVWRNQVLNHKIMDWIQNQAVVTNDFVENISKSRKCYEGAHNLEWLLKNNYFEPLLERLKLNQTITIPSDRGNLFFKKLNSNNISGNISAEKIKEIFELLYFRYKDDLESIFNLMETAALEANVMALEFFKGEMDKNKFPQEPTVLCIENAILSGDLDTIKFFVQHKFEFLKDFKYLNITKCLHLNSKETIKYLILHGLLETNIQFRSEIRYQIFNKLLLLDLDIFELLLPNIHYLDIDLVIESTNLFEMSSDHLYRVILIYVTKFKVYLIDDKFNQPKLLELLAPLKQQDRVKLLELFFTEIFPIIKEYKTSAGSSFKHNKSIFIALHQFEKLKDEPSNMFLNLFDVAIQYQNLNLLKYLIESDYKPNAKPSSVLVSFKTNYQSKEQLNEFINYSIENDSNLLSKHKNFKIHLFYCLLKLNNALEFIVKNDKIKEYFNPILPIAFNSVLLDNLLELSTSSTGTSSSNILSSTTVAEYYLENSKFGPKDDYTELLKSKSTRFESLKILLNHSKKLGKNKEEYFGMIKKVFISVYSVEFIPLPEPQIPTPKPSVITIPPLTSINESLERQSVIRLLWNSINEYERFEIKDHFRVVEKESLAKKYENSKLIKYLCNFKYGKLIPLLKALKLTSNDISKEFRDFYEILTIQGNIGMIKLVYDNYKVPEEHTMEISRNLIRFGHIHLLKLLVPCITITSEDTLIKSTFIVTRDKLCELIRESIRYQQFEILSYLTEFYIRLYNQGGAKPELNLTIGVHHLKILKFIQQSYSNKINPTSYLNVTNNSTFKYLVNSDEQYKEIIRKSKTSLKQKDNINFYYYYYTFSDELNIQYYISKVV